MNRAPSTRNQLFQKGFTLIEILTVLIVMSILVAVAAPGLLGVIKSTRLTSSGDSLINYINLAQQEAIATNIPTEIRFYRYGDEAELDSSTMVRAYQVVRLGSLEESAPSQDDSGEYQGVVAIAEPIRLDGSLTISTDSQLSPVLKDFFNEGRRIFKTQEVEYSALRFYPDGSFRIPTRASGGAASEVGVVSSPLNESFLTIVEASDADTSPGELKNYYCIQIDPFTGKARIYRP